MDRGYQPGVDVPPPPEPGLYHNLNSQAVLLGVCRNDPSIVGLSIYSFGGLSGDWWRRAGEAIGKNSRLESLEIADLRTGDFITLCRGVAENRSIRDLFVLGCELTDDFFAIMSPFFDQKCNLRSIGFEGCLLNEGGRLHSLASLLSKCKEKSLVNVELGDNQIDDEVAAEFIETTLCQYDDLTKLELGVNRIGRDGCIAMARLLNNPKRRFGLQELDFSRNTQMTDECIAILSNALIESNTVKKLDLSDLNMQRITPTGWCIFATVLYTPGCSLQKFRLNGAALDDISISALAHALKVNSSLQEFALCGIQSSITDAGWRSLSEGLAGPNSVLEELTLFNCGITDEAAIAIANASASHCTLKRLNLGLNRFVTPEGWTRFFNILLDSELVLDELRLAAININDDVAVATAEFARRSTSLKKLDLVCCDGVSSAGWQHVITTLVQNPNSTLPHLTLGDGMNDDVAISLATALVNNTSLKKCTFGEGRIGSMGFNALFHALCDTSSINGTYSSNHTFQEIVFHVNVGRRDVSTVLTMNRNDNKREVARQKILKYHFSEHLVDANLEAFTSMEWELLPQAIEWIGRNALGSSLLYQLARGMPTLFESGVKSRVAEAKHNFGEAK